MWFRQYKDYPIDTALKHEKVEPSRGIIGCEMHEINGWGNSLHIQKKRKKGFIALLLSYFFANKDKEK